MVFRLDRRGSLEQLVTSLDESPEDTATKCRQNSGRSGGPADRRLLANRLADPYYFARLADAGPASNRRRQRPTAGVRLPAQPPPRVDRRVCWCHRRLAFQGGIQIAIFSSPSRNRVPDSCRIVIFPMNSCTAIGRHAGLQRGFSSPAVFVAVWHADCTVVASDRAPPAPAAPLMRTAVRWKCECRGQ